MKKVITDISGWMVRIFRKICLTLDDLTGALLILQLISFESLNWKFWLVVVGINFDLWRDWLLTTMPWWWWYEVWDENWRCSGTSRGYWKSIQTHCSYYLRNALTQAKPYLRRLSSSLYFPLWLRIRKEMAKLTRLVVRHGWPDDLSLEFMRSNLHFPLILVIEIRNAPILKRSSPHL